MQRCAQPVYGFRDHANGIPRTRFRALRHASSRYSARIAASIEHMFVSTPIVLDSADGASGRHPPDHDAAADAARHVHSYLLPGEDGWTLVDTGIGLPDAQEVWAASLDGAEVVRIFITHFHPDHVGAAADVAELTGAPVSQGTLDYAQCELVWGNTNWPERIADWFRHPRRPGARSPRS